MVIIGDHLINNKPYANTADLSILIKILDEIKNRGNLKGVLYANRDGDLITENTDMIFDKNEFTAMCASVLKSAETLGESLDGQIKTITSEINEFMTMILECDDSTFLVFVIDDNSNLNPILKELNNILIKIKDAY